MESVPLPDAHGFVHGTDGDSVRLFPWKLKGEGHFLCLLRKKEAAGSNTPTQVPDRKKHNESFLKKHEDFSAFRKQIHLSLEEMGYYWEREGQLYLLPISPKELPSIRFLRTGLLLGTEKKNRFEPSQALAMFLKKESFSNTVDFSLDDPRTIKYLKGETIDIGDVSGNGSDGWCLICCDGWPLGFAKKNKQILKNKYYPGWRWQ